MPVAIAWARMYRGEHHPTDIVGSMIFAALWLTATTLLIKPNAQPAAGRQRSALLPTGLRRRPAVTPAGKG
jgi:undecaprenyl-diphosphatase